MPTTVVRVGGTFAPPLDAAKLAAYREAAKAAAPAVRAEIEKLCTMAEVFAETPPSSAPGTPHGSGRGTITPLAPAEVARIWEHVPWDHETPGEHLNECAQLEALFLPLEADKQSRNVARLAAWREACADQLFSARLPGEVRGLCVDAVRRLRRLAAAAADSAKAADAATVELLLPVAFPGRDAAAARKIYDGVRAWREDVLAAFSPGGTPPLPKPALEPTPLRDAAFHLLWYAKELAQDREPMTLDRL